MYAYIRDNNIAFISHAPVAKTVIEAVAEPNPDYIEEGDIPASIITQAEVPNPLLEWTTEVEYDNTITNPVFIDWVISQKISIEEAHNNIKQMIISWDISWKIDLSWGKFSDIEKWEIISKKIYGWNIYAEIAEARRKSELLDKATSKYTAKDKEDWARIVQNESTRNQILLLLK